MAVAAMAHANMGKADLAGTALRKARDIARNCDGKDLAQGKPILPNWLEEAIADLLIKEAGERVATASRRGETIVRTSSSGPSRTRMRPKESPLP